MHENDEINEEQKLSEVLSTTFEKLVYQFDMITRLAQSFDHRLSNVEDKINELKKLQKPNNIDHIFQEGFELKGIENFRNTESDKIATESGRIE